MALSLGGIHNAPIKKKIYKQPQAYIHSQITYGIYALKLVLTNSLKNVTQLTLGSHNSQKTIKATNELVKSSNQH